MALEKELPSAVANVKVVAEFQSRPEYQVGE
jgi:hypothetical protein